MQTRQRSRFVSGLHGNRAAGAASWDHNRITLVVQALAASLERTGHMLNVDTGRVAGAHVWQQQQVTELSSPLACLNNYAAFPEARLLDLGLI